VLAVRRHPDDADHRASGEADAVVDLDDAVLDLEQARQRRLNLFDQLPVAGDQRRDAPLDRVDLDQARTTRTDDRA
jgi:hypothetical protein